MEQALFEGVVPLGDVACGDERLAAFTGTGRGAHPSYKTESVRQNIDMKKRAADTALAA